MYVDESGDSGLPTDNSPTRYFCLSGLVVHELRWQETVGDLLDFRRHIKRQYKVYLDDELHSSEMIHKPAATAPSFQALKKHERLAIVRQFADRIAGLAAVRIINVVVDKQTTKLANKDEVFRAAWYRLFQRFENTIGYQNFPGPPNASERGLVFPDSTDAGRLRKYLNDMRSHNRLKLVQASGAFHYIDSPLRLLIEDPVMRDSRHSYLVQAADCVVFLLKQSLDPSAYMRKHGGRAYFARLDRVLCKEASRKDSQGIVWV